MNTVAKCAIIRNSIFWNNTAADYPQINDWSCTVDMANSIVQVEQ